MNQIIVVLIILALGYGIVKLHSLYKKTRDKKYIILLCILLLFVSDAWIGLYGVNVKDFFIKYRFLFTFIPLGIYLLYSFYESKRKKEEEEKKKIKQAFQQYMMPSIVEEMMKHPEKLKLGGEKKTLSIFFSDIRGFTSISEKLGAHRLVTFLNEYLSEMSEIILQNRGVIDKYIGDAIMGFWGAPIDEPEHAYLACKTSCEMVLLLGKLQKKWKERGMPKVDIGIGLNTGDVVVGNMGSNKRFDYTVLGDHVNLASRLEGLNKAYGTNIIVSESMYKLVKGKFLFRELDHVIVKGKKKPVRIYELICDHKQKDLAISFEKALKDYGEKKFEKAKKQFRALNKKYGDKASMIYIERCDSFIKNPPKGDVFIHEHKEK